MCADRSSTSRAQVPAYPCGTCERPRGGSAGARAPVDAERPRGGSADARAPVDAELPDPAGPTGDQDARSSNPVSGTSSRLAPNPSVMTLVTVPLGIAYPGTRASRASDSQLQPTSPSSGSAAISGSTSART